MASDLLEELRRELNVFAKIRESLLQSAAEMGNGISEQLRLLENRFKRLALSSPPFE